MPNVLDNVLDQLRRGWVARYGGQQARPEPQRQQMMPQARPTPMARNPAVGQPLGADDSNQPVTDPSQLYPAGSLLSYSGMDGIGGSGSGLSNAIHSIIQSIFGGGSGGGMSQSQALATGNQIGPAGPSQGSWGGDIAPISETGSAPGGSVMADNSGAWGGDIAPISDTGGGAGGAAGGAGAAAGIAGGIASAIGQFAKTYQSNEPKNTFTPPNIPLPKPPVFQPITLRGGTTGVAPWQT
jgi:hypothetical protein